MKKKINKNKKNAKATQIVSNILDHMVITSGVVTFGVKHDALCNKLYFPDKINTQKNKKNEIYLMYPKIGGGGGGGGLGGCL